MSSIIDYFNANNIEYSASALTFQSGYEPEKAFAKSNNYFYSTNSPSGQWWQVSFSRNVVISSYFITYDSSNGCSAKMWDVSISDDNKTFTVVKTEIISSTIAGNTSPFSLDSPVSCKHFRLTLKQMACSTNQFFFRAFDCFGEVKNLRRTRIACSCNFPRYRRQLISNFFLVLLPSIINK